MTPFVLAAFELSVLCVVGAAKSQGWDRAILVGFIVLPWALVGGAWWAMRRGR